MKVLVSAAVLLFLIFSTSCTDDEQLEFETYRILTQEEYNASKFNRFPTQNDTISINNQTYVIANPYFGSGTLRLKGAMHNHTENSVAVDGYLSGKSPQWTCEKYRDEAGYDFISITDHNFVSDVPEVSGIVWMGAALEDTNTTPEEHHLIVYNLPKGYQYQYVSDEINEQIEYYHSLGAFVSYAHADWKAQYQPDEKILNVRQLDFIEVLNCGCGSTRAYNSMLLKGPVGALGTDDFHYNPDRYEADKFFNKSYIIVYGHKKERKAIWDDILRGHFYASSGATMEISYSSGTIYVSTDTPSLIEVHGVDLHHPTNEVVIDYAKDSYSHSYTFDGNQPVIWIRITNSTGQAISQAFHIKMLV